MRHSSETLGDSPESAGGEGEPPVAGGAPPLGAWQQTEGDPPRRLLVTEDRFVLETQGMPFVSPVRHEPGALLLDHPMHPARLTFERSEERLTLRHPEGVWTLEPLDRVPDALDVSPLPLGDAGPVPDATVKAVGDDLRQRMDRSAEAHARLRPGSGPPDPALVREFQQVARDNAAYLAQVLAAWGWVDAPRFGEPAARAAVLLVHQTSDLRLLQTALRGLRAEFEAGRLEPQALAFLEDRTRLGLGRPQLYGTSVLPTRPGVLTLAPLEEPEEVDARRAALGLSPLADWIEECKRSTGSDQVEMPE